MRTTQEIHGDVPMVSVVMPVHNALPFLDAAIESILCQSEPNFEFVILDDASIDGSRDKLHEWAQHDERIRIIEVEQNLGPALSSQRVALAARAPLVARMDADDISHPDRLRAQLDVFRNNPQAGVVACLCDFIDANGAMPRDCEHWRLTRRSVLAPFAHGTIMYRRELFDWVGGYREQCVFWEDQDLIARIAAKAAVVVIPRPLYRYRLSSSSTRIASNQDQLEHSVDLMYRSVERLERHEQYEDLLRDFVADGRKVNPRVFVSLGSQMLWAGGRPRLFRRMLHRGDMKFGLNTIVAATWTAWASASPATLRSFLRILIYFRNLVTRARIHSGEAIVWNPHRSNKAVSGSVRPVSVIQQGQNALVIRQSGITIDRGMIREAVSIQTLVNFEAMAGPTDAAA